MKVACSYQPPCPTPEKHTPHPKRQFAHAAWAEEMLRTHKQTRCPGCNLWAIWVRLPEAPDLPPVEYRIDHKECGCCNGETPGCRCRVHEPGERTDGSAAA